MEKLQKMPLIFLVVIIISLLIGGSFYIHNKQSTAERNKDMLVPNQAEPDNVELLADKNGWMTYKNYALGFEFKYPTDTFVKSDYDDKDPDTQELIYLKSIKDYKCGYGFEDINFAIVNSASRDVAPQYSEQGTYFGKNGFYYNTGSESSAVTIYDIEFQTSQTLVITGHSTCRLVEPTKKEVGVDDVISTIKFTNSN